MKKYGFIRVSSISPKLKLANVIFNKEEIIKQIKIKEKEDVSIILFPELSLTGYTCNDLFFQDKLLEEVEKALIDICNKTKDLEIISVIGAPLSKDNQLFNTTVVIQKGKILGIVPKTNLINPKEYPENRWFSSSKNSINNKITINNEEIPFSTNLLFQEKNNKKFTFGIEISSDNYHTLNGATIILNPSANIEVIGSYKYRKNLLQVQSKKTTSAYVHASSGIYESTQDFVFSGHTIIYENGNLLNEGERFSLDTISINADIDLQKINNLRIQNKKNNYFLENKEYQIIPFESKTNIKKLNRNYKQYPFVPSNEKKEERLKEIIEIQTSGLIKRLLHTNIKKCVIGMSGGMDSTLAFLILINTYKKLNLDTKNIIGITMPGFGTTSRTYHNAIDLMKSYNVTTKEISIKEACTIHYKDIGHDINNHDITYENSQARERTQILMDVANMENALVIGTGDLSELALGWCTYNGDHMSMYAVNSNIPKTLVRHLITYLKNEGNNEQKRILEDILSTPISPELLPLDNKGNLKQETEKSIGPYVLHDFFLYHFLKYGASKEKILLLAKKTFEKEYSKEEIEKYLNIFIKRFFSQQFKRSCLPDGVKVGTIGLSPRGDLLMPSDIDSTIWL